MTELQRFLREGGTLDQLKSDYGISANPSVVWPNLLLFKYSQIESPMQERIVQESRGIILDSGNDWHCVARGFDKFFNYGEPNAVAIDWSTARVQEKVDGSLCLLYFYESAWHVATTGSAAASGPVNNGPITFAELFWETYAVQCEAETKDFFDEIQNRLPRNLTYMIELTTPQNRVIVNHERAYLTLLGARKPHHGEWVDTDLPAISQILKIPAVREFPFAHIDEILASLTDIDPLEQEGYVVVDAAFNRIKVKHPQYVALHHMKEQASMKTFVEVVRQGEVPEIIASFPELSEKFTEVTERFETLCQQIAADYAPISHIETQKDFAFEALKTRLPAALFKLRAKQVTTPKEFLAQLPLDNLLKHLGYKELAE